MRRHWGWTFTDPEIGFYSYGDCPRWAAKCREAGWLIESRILIIGSTKHCNECDEKH